MATPQRPKSKLDRFIPQSISKNIYCLSLLQENQYSKYQQLLSQKLLNLQTQQSKLLHFTPQHNNQQNIPINHQNHHTIKISSEPYKILGVPMLRDDFYLNLVDWSDSKIIGVGLHSSIYLWSKCTTNVIKLYQAQNFNSYVCSLAFMKHHSKIAFGQSEGQVKIYDIQKKKPLCTFDNLHFGRVSSIGCTNNLICTGSKDGFVSIQDLRDKKQIMRYKAHQQEICGLKICPRGDMVATGGNDNKLLLFSMRKMQKLAAWSNHKAAVKAIGFNPSNPSVASGGGTADRRIRIFSLQTLEMINEVDTGSQICNLMYSPVSRELVTTHGYSLNQINLWQWDANGTLKKTKSLMGHKSRVLYLAGQEQTGRIATAAGDQELRLWSIFNGESSSCTQDLR